MESQLPLHLPPELQPPDWPPPYRQPPDWPPHRTPPISLDLGFQVYLYTRFFSASKSISTLAWLCPPSSVSNSSGLPGCGPGLEPDRMVQSGLLPGKQGYPTIPTTLAPIKYLSFDCIMIWSMRKLFNSSRCFISCIQICNLTDIRWMVVN